LQTRYPADFALADEEIRAWQRREAEAAEAGKDWPTAVFHRGWLIEADPADAGSRASRARAREELKQDEEAEADYSGAIERRPDAPALVRRGLVRERLGKPDAALEDYTRAVGLDGKSEDAWLARGSLHAAQARWAAAADDFARLVGLKPGHVKARHFLALTYLARDDLADYRATCRTMLHGGAAAWVSAPDRAAWLCVLGAGAVTEADTEFAELRKFFDLEANLAEARATVGVATAWRDDPVDVLTTRGALAYRLGHDDEAVRALGEGRKRLRQDGSAWDWLFLALAEQRRGQTDAAGRWLKRAQEWVDAEGARLSWDRRLELRLLRREAERTRPPGKP
jgi:tetratricopeptide (TPR) repeat protein